jgi:Mn-dependent DtxR family transcriptional regulator
MDSKQEIVRYIKKKGRVKGHDLSARLNISRQAVHKHLRQLIQAGKISKTGITRGAYYSLTEDQRRRHKPKSLRRSYVLQGLEEDQVWLEIDTELNLKRALSSTAHEIARYAFTEMMNNAIEHSQSKKCQMESGFDAYHFWFRLRDYGIGLFYSISSKLKLRDENEALFQLLKGKTTTMKERHSGEGIYFTSKAVDFLSFRSHKILLVFDNLQKNVFAERKRFIKGTEVLVLIRKRSKRKLQSVFAEFAPEEFDYRFEKTRVLVRLLGTDYVSRSEARRLLQGLEKFQEVILDFKHVKSLGQAFADEIVRVFAQSHPHIRIRVVNLDPALQPIVRHVQVDNSTNDQLTIS